jgi:diguanylate cyclase (GGDEF)-like protein
MDRGCKMPHHDDNAVNLLGWRLWLFPSVISFILFFIAQYSFLGFHTFTELFTIIISFSLFSFAWWTRDLNKNNLFLFLACGYFWIGLLDLFHTLTYKGMSVLVLDDGNISTQLWLASRYMESMLLLAGPLIANQRIKAFGIFYVYGLLSLIFILAILNGHFPTAFIEGTGLTQFKILSEYAIDVILVASIYTLWRYAPLLSKDEKSLISMAIIFTILAEISFTFYISVYGLSNLAGHIFKLFSFWMIFQAVVVANLKTPYAKLRESELRFKNIFDNSEVSIWEEDLSKVATELDTLRKNAIPDLRQYLFDNPEFVLKLAEKVRVVNVNNATLNLFKAKTKGEFLTNINNSFTPDAINIFIESLCAIWDNHKSFFGEITYKTQDGETIDAIVSFQIPQEPQGFRSVPINIVDITERKRNEALISYQANYDFLTGLANRNLFSDRLSHAIDIAVKENSKLTVLFIDLDGFKYINDSKGHETGDALLKLVSQRIMNSIRQSDTVARLGGDEFAVLLPGSHIISDIESRVIKIQKEMNLPYQLESIEAYITASVGIAVYPKDGLDTTELLRKADSAMYKAKVKGANKFQFFTPKIDADAQKRMALEQAMRSAIKNNDFTVHYQPVLNIETGHAEHVEALIRWQHTDMGNISPIDFIPLAEELGLINEIGEFVLVEACKQAVLWSKIYENSPSIAVNLSSQQFINQEIVELIESTLKETGLPANKLTLEITEGLFMNEEHSPLEQLEQIRNLGVSLSIDDFGTGYSSLSYLKRFPISTLKIDRSFVSGLPNDLEDASLIKTILLLAKSLHLKVIAEGVETKGQEIFLKANGCIYIQGYLHSKPLPIDAFNTWLTSNKSNSTSIQQSINIGCYSTKKTAD